MTNLISDKIKLLNITTLESLNAEREQEIAGSFTQTGIKILGADFGFAWWKLGKNYRQIYKSNNTPYNPNIPRKKGGNYEAQKSRSPVFVSAAQKEKYAKKYDVSPYMKSYVIIPVTYKNHIYGNLVICYKKPRSFSAEDRTLSEALGHSAAQAITINRLMKQKDEFLSIASHELKTPVTTIRGFTQLLQKRLEKDEKLNHFLAKINLQVDKLTHLVGDLLDFSRIEAGKLKFETMEIDLGEVARDAIEDLQFTAEKHEIILKNAGELRVIGNPERLSQVLNNLITNAIKYSPGEDKVIVSLSRDDDYARVSVRDFGMGIPANMRHKIFERFFQTNDFSSQTFPGLGLGLYISQEIVKRHEGQIWVESHVGRGATFHFRLPLAIKSRQRQGVLHAEKSLSR